MKKIILIVLSIFLISAIIINAAPVSEQIIVDQIGYRTTADKWFMIADPQTGQNAAVTYVPGANVQLRRASDNVTVMTIPLTAWNGGTTHSQSGDKVWQGDFSSYTTPGTYYIYDPTNNYQSYNFEIKDDVYNNILKASIKSYYYQRCGTAITSAYGGTWTHAACHVTTQQNALLYDASLGGIQNGTQRDITGGWHDAGDYRKYTSWMAPIINDLCVMYEWYPNAFSDATGIPESGNGVPDILDEVKWELDWMLKMQRADGALYSGVFVVSGINGTGDGIGDPSTENRPYFYANYSTAATGSGAIAFAIGARVFAAFNSAYPGYAATLQTAAINAWNFLKNNPANKQYNHTNFDNADANMDDNADRRYRVWAAAELFRLTGGTEYKTYFESNYNNSNTSDGTHQPILSGYFETGASASIQRGLVSYCLASGANATIVNTIKASLNQGVQNQAYGQRNNDPYKCYNWDGHYSWGSTSQKAEWAIDCLWAVKLNVNPSMSATYLKIAEEYLHYYHGRNPLSWCYLTQSNLSGADKQITQIYHGWFHNGTVWDTNPAPGILAGGPNQYFAPDPSYGGQISPPQNNPPMKSYKDWNTSWPENSWEVTENSTGYQCRYSFIAAAFAAAAGPTSTPTNTYTHTSTITPGGPTLTYTYTPTNTNTNTNTATSTPTPASIIFNTCDSLTYNGTWSGANATRTIDTTTTAAITQGTGALRIAVNTVAAWQDGAATLGGFAPVNWSNVSRLEMDVYVPPGQQPWGATDAWHELTFYVNSASAPGGAKWYRMVTTGQNISTGMNHVVFTLNWTLDTEPNPILPTDPLSSLIFIINSENGNTGVIYFDNMVLYSTAPAQTNTPTSTSTHTATYTATYSPTSTNSSTATNTSTNTYTATNTNTPANTATNTATHTYTNTATSTNTFTQTYTETETITPGGPTLTFTDTFTVTNTPTHTHTFTHTFTNTETETATYTATNTYTELPTNTYTNTNTQQPTSTTTNTNTIPAATSTFTNTVAGVCLMDNGEDGDNTNLFGGYWYTYSSGNGTSVVPVQGTTFTMTAGGSSVSPLYAAHFTGTVGTESPDYPSIGMGVQLNPMAGAPPDGTGQVTDISGCTGVRFYAKGDGKTYHIKIPYTDIGDNTLTGYNDYRYDFAAGASWTPVVVPFTLFAQATGWGTQYPLSTVLQNAKAFQFQTSQYAPSGTITAELWIDDLELYGCTSACPGAATETPTYTQAATNTPTFTYTNTAVNTNTPVNTSTNTPTSVITNTFTPVNTFTSTYTPVFTMTYTVTYTYTAAISPTYTHTPVFTATETLTPVLTSTPTPVATKEKLEIKEQLAYPNPVNPGKDGGFIVKFAASRDYNEKQLLVYTSALRLIREVSYKGAFAAGDGYIGLVEKDIKQLSNGTYYYVLSKTTKAIKQKGQ